MTTELLVQTAQKRLKRLNDLTKRKIMGTTIRDKTARNTEYQARYRAENPEKIREARKRRYHENKEKDRQWRLNGLNRLRAEVIDHYGSICAMCKEPDQDVLVVVWIDKGQDPFKSGGGSTKRLRDIRKAGFPEGYVIKCHNCNAKTRKINRAWVSREEEKEKEEMKRIDDISEILESA